MDIKEPLYYTVIDGEDYPMNWESLLEEIRLNPVCKKGEETKPFAFGPDRSYNLKELAIYARIKLEIV